MTIKDRFLDYWNTDLEYEDYKYDLSVFEQIIYGFSGTWAVIIAVLSVPLWGIPYVIYKFIKLTKR